jgi:hypothetical protein
VLAPGGPGDLGGDGGAIHITSGASDTVYTGTLSAAGGTGDTTDGAPGTVIVDTTTMDPTP